ncbi:hypothetical protein [Collibacillus ludicampi]|nr:hypothetical protein [Collibacillus ludicampi]
MQRKFMEAWNHKDADDALRTMEKLAMPIENCTQVRLQVYGKGWRKL